MANLTLSIDDELLRRARIRALEHGTSVNAIVREHIAAFAGDDPTEAAATRFLELAASSTAGTPGAKRAWTRDSLYER